MAKTTLETPRNNLKVIWGRFLLRCYGQTSNLCENSLFEGDFVDFGHFEAKIGHFWAILSKNVL